MKIFSFLFNVISACPEKWVEDVTTGICSPDGAFELVCNSDGTASLTLELEHFYSDLPDDTTDLETGLQLTDGWSRRYNSVLGVNEWDEKIFLSSLNPELVHHPL